MIKTTPFHERLSELNTDRALRRTGPATCRRCATTCRPKHEYFAVRNSAGFFDTSPLYKYRITRPRRRAVPRRHDDPRHPARAVPAGRSTPSGATTAGSCSRTACVFRHSDDDFLLTAAEPNLGYLERPRSAGSTSTIEDVTRRATAMLAVQGPRSREILAKLAPEVDDLAFFELRRRQDRQRAGDDLAHRLHRRPRLRGPRRRPTTRSACSTRSIEAGEGHGLRPFGEEALLMTRIEAGLVLINVEFSSSRFAYTDHDRITPKELGFGWMLKGIDADDRPFIGRDAIRRELADKTSRWATVGLVRRLGRLRPALQRGRA